MNTFILKSLFLSACMASVAAGQGKSDGNSNSGGSTPEDEWTVTLIQRHLAGTGVFQGPVGMEGSQVSFAPIPEGGSEFTLWAYHNNPLTGLQEHLVDTETVGSYLPEGRIWITTEDPYVGPIPRTRIDQGFTLNYEVEGLVQSEDAPLAASKVLLDHNVATTDGDPKDKKYHSEEDFAQVFIERNGVGAFPFAASNLPGTDLSQISGKEVFRLYALPDGQVAELELSSAEVQVWPLATGAFSGVQKGATYTAAPQVSVDLVNLYPGSETWVQYYPGPYVAGTVGTRITPNTVWATPDVPLSTTMELTQLDSTLLETGEWTLEVLTRTPFGVESVTYTSLSMDRNLKLRGSFQALKD